MANNQDTPAALAAVLGASTRFSSRGRPLTPKKYLAESSADSSSSSSADDEPGTPASDDEASWRDDEPATPAARRGRGGGVVSPDTVRRMIDPTQHDARFGISEEERRKSDAVNLANGRSPRAGGQCNFEVSPHGSPAEARAWRRATKDRRTRFERRRSARVMGTPAMWTGADDWFKMQRAILGDAEIRNGTKLPKNFLMRIRRRTPRRYRGGVGFFRRHLADAMREILPFYPEWREVLRKAPSVSIRKNGGDDYGWDAPSVVSWDDTLQRLVLDHVVVELTGELAGFADIYLLGIIEHSDNDLVSVLKRLSAWGLWDP